MNIVIHWLELFDFLDQIYIVDEEDVFLTLQTRAASFIKQIPPTSEPVKRSGKRNAAYLKCVDHNPPSKKNDKWKPENNSCPSCILFNATESLPNGVLPTRKSILENVQYFKDLASCEGQSQQASPTWLVSKDIDLHWIFCNVYPKPPNSVQYVVESLWKELHYLRSRDNKKKNPDYWKKYQSFITVIDLVPDFVESNPDRRQAQEKLWNCKMNENDKTFHKLQLQNPPSGYCTTFVDRKWKSAQERKESRLNHSRNEYCDFASVTVDEQSDLVDDMDVDPTFEEYEPSHVTKKKYQYTKELQNDADDMPLRYRNIRNGLRSVRPEIYTLLVKLKSKYHMSQHQAEAAIVETGNALFGRDWKYFDPEEPTDSNTLPAGSNTRRVEPYFEAMALSTIVEEIMSGSKAVMYANDGSAMNSVGSYVVQSITIDGVQRPLPTLSIFTETRESLEELEVMTVKMLSAAVGYKYSEKEILQRIDFVMTDSTSHNLTVMENV